MGMDVYGNNPTSETGRYFRNNVWFWRPLAMYCQHVAEDVCKACESWHSNDGDGLDAKGALALAEALELEISTGRTSAEEARWRHAVESQPDEPCNLCGGTGARRDSVGVEHGFHERVCEDVDVYDYHGKPHPRAGHKGWCNGCNGRGFRRPDMCHYPFTAENVEEFIAFLKDSGGFKIC